MSSSAASTTSSSRAPSTANPSLTLSPATPADTPAIAPAFFSAFHALPYFRAMMPDTPGSRAAFERAVVFAINDPCTRVLKVTDETTGRIVGSGQWVLPRTKEDADTAHPGTEEGRWADFPACCDAELANALFGAFAENRHEMMGGRRHYYMELLYTAEGYKGKGAGSMILQYGCEMADRDGLEAYIDASPGGKPLYERFGWVFTKQVKLPRFDYYYDFGVRQPKQ